MKNLHLLLLIPAFLVSIHASSQNEEPFKPNGKPEIRIFTHFSTTLSDGKNFNKFDVTRAYLGYVYNFSGTLTGRITFDASKPSVGNFHYAGLLRFAYLQIHTGKFILTGGMIPTPQFEQAEKRWGYRYVFKTTHDEYGFGPGADMGISAVCNIRPWLTADAMLVNGEGYKQMEADSAFRAGIGISVMPTKYLFVRGYCDRMQKDQNKQQSLDFIIAFENKRINLSAVFNFQKDHAMIKGQDYKGLSINGSLFLKENQKLFARFDHIYSEKIGQTQNPWNLSKDGNQFIIGFEFSPVTGIKLSPNFQGWEPADHNLPFISKYSLNAEIRL